MLFIHLRSETSDRNLFDGEIQKRLVGFHDVPRTVFEKRNGRGERPETSFATDLLDYCARASLMLICF